MWRFLFAWLYGTIAAGAMLIADPMGKRRLTKAQEYKRLAYSVVLGLAFAGLLMWVKTL